jgi:hypothetical protein
MAGLIDGLRTADIHPGPRMVPLGDLRALLRSDETREALAREIQQHRPGRKDEASFRPSTCSCAEWESWEQPWREHLADAVVRVLTGEEGDRG